MTSSHIELRGYAMQFNQVAIVGERLEQFAPAAFDRMLVNRTQVELRWGSHASDAPRLASNVTLFSDTYGLGFCATIDMSRISWSRIAAITRASRPMAFASVGGLIIHSWQRDQMLGDAIGDTINNAKIDHICLCDDPAYRGTGAWPAHLVDGASWRIRQLANQWERGFAAYQTRQAIARQPVPPKAERLEGFFAARAGVHARPRERVIRDPLKGEPQIIGHAAFTSAHNAK